MKSKFLLIVSFFFISLIVKAQNPNVEVEPTPEPSKTKITGRVIYEDTGKPVRRGSLGLLQIVGKERYGVKIKSLTEVNSLGVITNDNGEFTIEDLASGEYYPKIDVAGVLNPEDYVNLINEDDPLNAEKLDQLFEKIVVVEGVKEEQILIRAKRGGAISGRVLYSDGEPVVGVEVEALQTGDSGFELKYKTKTDDRGFYRFSGLSQDKYIIRIVEPTVRKLKKNVASSAARFSDLKTYYGDTAILKEAKSIELHTAEEKNDINITIPDHNTYTISGVVTSKSAKIPIREARITFERKEEAEYLSSRSRSFYPKSLQTDEKGNFTINDLPKGVYTFTVYPPDKSDNELPDEKSKQEPKYAETSKEIVIEDKDLKNEIIEMPIASKISGTLTFEDKREIKDAFFLVVDETLQRPSVTSFSDKEYKELRKTRPSEWKFVVSNVSDGNYYPFVGISNETENFYVKSIMVGGKDWLNSILEINENSDITDVKVVLATDVGIIKGKIETNSEKPLSQLQLILIPADKPNARALVRVIDVSESGEFSEKVAPGEYFLTDCSVSDWLEIRTKKYQEWREKFTKDAKKVTIKPNETTTVIIKK